MTSGDSLDKLYKDMVKEVEPNKQKFMAYAQRIWREKYNYIYCNRIDEKLTNNIFL